MVYGVFPQAMRILHGYLDPLSMFSSAGGYFRVPFKCQCGVTQGILLSPTIFIMMVYAVLRHWVSVVAAIEGASDLCTEGFGRYIQCLVAYFYSDDLLLTST